MGKNVRDFCQMIVFQEQLSYDRLAMDQFGEVLVIKYVLYSLLICSFKPQFWRQNPLCELQPQESNLEDLTDHDVLAMFA